MAPAVANDHTFALAPESQRQNARGAVFDANPLLAAMNSAQSFATAFGGAQQNLRALGNPFVTSQAQQV